MSKVQKLFCLSSVFFRRLLSDFTERISTKLRYIIHLRLLFEKFDPKAPAHLPPRVGEKITAFWTDFELTKHIFATEHDINNRKETCQSTRTPRFGELWSRNGWERFARFCPHPYISTLGDTGRYTTDCRQTYRRQTSEMTDSVTWTIRGRSRCTDAWVKYCMQYVTRHRVEFRVEFWVTQWYFGLHNCAVGGVRYAMRWRCARNFHQANDQLFQKISLSWTSSNSKLDSKLDLMKFETLI